MRMGFLGKKPATSKPKGYADLYKAEFDRQERADLKRQVIADVKQARKTPEDLRRERREKIIKGADTAIKAKDRAYKNIGGSISIRKDALSKARGVGKGHPLFRR